MPAPTSCTSMTLRHSTPGEHSLIHLGYTHLNAAECSSGLFMCTAGSSCVQLVAKLKSTITALMNHILLIICCLLRHCCSANVYGSAVYLLHGYLEMPPGCAHC